jgi:hypothetical protein
MWQDEYVVLSAIKKTGLLEVLSRQAKLALPKNDLEIKV